MSAVLTDPKAARTFRFVRARYADGVAELAYAFDAGPELVEKIAFPNAPVVPEERRAAFAAALRLLHLVAGVSYYKAGVPPQIVLDEGTLDERTADLLDAVYRHGLGEFAWQNRLELDVRFPRSGSESSRALPESRLPPLPQEANLPRRTLVPIGGGKDSLVSVELLRSASEPVTCAWVGSSPLIAACVARTGLPPLNIGRTLSPVLFELNRRGAWNGHIPVTAINSAILVCAALLYGYDAIAFSNERSASAATLEDGGREVNHQWSKSWDFERAFGDWVHAEVAPDLDYFSLLRPLSELAVTRLFAKLDRYHDCFSSCNRNFRILGERPESRWCGACPKCHFVFLALAPFVAKPKLVAIFGRNLLDDEALASGFDALVEWHAHKPFECVGEARESRAAFAALTQRAEWREDALVARFCREIMPNVRTDDLALEALLAPQGPHRVPARLVGCFGGMASSAGDGSHVVARREEET